ncbi:MAG: dual specificity protein phosphatase family protein [Gordonia sp. (in: high G+C Gram-positive bacteria)]|uniref:protein-tyrosine phosphatase family protein n=1 Tax=Gordonia sp. (in: high G+C Gram-positive bacteria) TaxID=84139 RepID=UPI0039E60546
MNHPPRGSLITARMGVKLNDGDISMPMFSEIAEGIWQAGCPQDKLPLPGRFRHVVNLAGVLGFRPDHVLATSTVVDMTDSSTQSMTLVDPLARLVVDLSATGDDVLVHCQAGLNRSGVIVARALMHRGMTADEAITAVRAGRHPKALYNTHFVAWLHENPIDR